MAVADVSLLCHIDFAKAKKQRSMTNSDSEQWKTCWGRTEIFPGTPLGRKNVVNLLSKCHGMHSNAT